MSFNQIKEKAKIQLKPYAKTARLACLFFYLIGLCISVPYFIITKNTTNQFENSASRIVTLIYILYGGFLSPVLNMAYFALIAQIAKQSEAEEKKALSLKDYFSNFRLGLKGIGNYWWTSLWEFLWCMAIILPAVIVIIIPLVILESNNIISSEVSATVLPFFIILCIYPVMIYKMLSYCLNTYAIADDNETEVGEAMDISKELTKGHRWELFKFYLSFIGWYILILVTLGIATIWINPYINLSVFNFYKELEAQHNTPSAEPQTTN